MKFYVAGKWEDRDSVKEIMNYLEQQGHTITCDWTRHEYSDNKSMERYALDDMQGVLDADVFVGLFVKDLNYKGALVELGMAMASGKKVIIVGNAISSCIFIKHPDIVLLPDEVQLKLFV